MKAGYIAISIIIAMCIFVAGCGECPVNKQTAENNKPAPKPEKKDEAPTDITNIKPGELAKSLGKNVTITGTVYLAKMGWFVQAECGDIWLADTELPDETSDKKITAKGKLIQRSDLPVFIEKEGEPIRSGISVPPGTDLKEASKRYLIEKPEWKPAK